MDRIKKKQHRINPCRICHANARLEKSQKINRKKEQDTIGLSQLTIASSYAFQMFIRDPLAKSSNKACLFDQRLCERCLWKREPS